MNNTYDSKYSIAIEINLKLGNEPKNFDGTYSICMDIYNKLGGDKTSFDSIYSILESIMQLINAEHANKFDSIYSQCLSIYNKLGGEPKLFDSTYSILLGILPLVEPEPVGPPNDEIWYTSSDGNIVTPHRTEALPSVVSNTYSDGKGVIKCASDITSIGTTAFYLCSSLTSVTIPNSVTSLGVQAFDECSSLTSVTIPNCVTSIGNVAFGRCESLTSITIPNSVTSLGVQAFYWCSALRSITIPNGVTSIGSQTFRYCSSLTSVTISNSVTSIGDYAFADCSALRSITIPNRVTIIGEGAFAGCESLTSINVDSNNPNYSSVDGAVFNKDKTTIIQYPEGKQGTYIIPDSVTSIGERAFRSCSSLTSVTIPNSVTSIGDSAFGQISAKILFSKLYSTYTTKIFSIPSTATSITCNVEFNISEIPSGYNISSMLPTGPSQSNKGSITYNIYTDYAPCKDQALALADAKTIVNVYHIDGTSWE